MGPQHPQFTADGGGASLTLNGRVSLPVIQKFLQSRPAVSREGRISRVWVVGALQEGDRRFRRYQMHAFAVMPNHVHALLTPQVVSTRWLGPLKGSTAYRANRILGLDHVKAVSQQIKQASERAFKEPSLSFEHRNMHIVRRVRRCLMVF